MSDNPRESGSPSGRRSVFVTTQWSVVLAAGGESEQARSALEILCRTYWFPVYALVRRKGHDPESARDHTQEFFARLLSRDGLASVRRERGRFRAFLSQAVRNFLADEWDRSTALKRGGGIQFLSLETEQAEERYLELTDPVSPDLIFDRQWATLLVSTAYERLRAEYAASGKDWLLPLLEHGEHRKPVQLDTLAGHLGLPLNTLKSHIHRAQRRHAEIIREIVAETVGSPAEVEAELRHLLAALA